MTGSAARPIVVVLDGPPTPAWQAQTLTDLARSPSLRIVELRLAGARPRGRLRRAHATVEQRLFALGRDALAPVPLERPALDPYAGVTGGELVVWLAEGALPSGERRDLLHLRHGGMREPVEDAFRRATLRGVRTVETEVLIRRPDTTILVERTVSGARPFSSTLSRDRALWKFAGLVRRAAERAPGFNVPAAAAQRAGAPPSTLELVLRSPRAWLRVLSARALFARPWQIRVREHGADPTTGWSGLPGLVRWKPGHLYADPILFEHQGRHHLFCEEMLPGANQAVISHTELTLDGRVAEPPVEVLRAPHHLSYPFVFAHGDDVFMIPETSAQQRVELYRAVEFPRQWRREQILLDGVIASDATVLERDGGLWMFVGVSAPGATLLDELHLYTAAGPAGPWLAHPRNPIVSDVRCARPAGAIQRWGTRLIRPGQDGSRRYGGAISFRQIDELSLTGYDEHEVARIEPGDLGGDARATHTYAADGSFEAVDLRQRELRLQLSSAGLAGVIAVAARRARRLLQRRAGGQT